MVNFIYLLDKNIQLCIKYGIGVRFHSNIVAIENLHQGMVVQWLPHLANGTKIKH